MADDWIETTLGEILELKRGYDLPTQDRRPGHIPIVSSSGVSDTHVESRVAAPGVVTGRYGTIGKVFYIDRDFWPLNTTLYVRDFKGNHPRFISYFLKTIDYLAYSDKAAVPGVNRNHLHLAKVRIPPRKQQERIADILGSLDDKIDLNRRMNETLEAMARRLFRSWFVDFDPVHAKAALRREHPKLSNADLSRRALPQMAPEITELFPDGFEESTMGPIPKGWCARPLYEIANFVNGAAFKNSDFCDPSIGKPVIKIAELKSGIDSQTKFSQKDVGANREIHCGDTLYSWSGSPDTSLATFRWTGRDGLLNQHIFKVITENRPDEIFAYYQLNDLRDTLVEIARNKQTTGLGHVTVEDMKRLHVIQPTPEVLNAFAVSTGLIYDQSFNLSVDSLTLERTREKLLPSLLAGTMTVET
jgi:type I restriction enzyme S subunit